MGLLALGCAAHGLRRKEETNFLLYPALIPQRAMRPSGTYWAKLSSRLTALHFGGSCGVITLSGPRGDAATCPRMHSRLLK
jgi:hypothetical protein